MTDSEASILTTEGLGMDSAMDSVIDCTGWIARVEIGHGLDSRICL